MWASEDCCLFNMRVLTHRLQQNIHIFTSEKKNRRHFWNAVALNPGNGVHCLDKWS